jgi:hypothetical protein
LPRQKVSSGVEYTSLITLQTIIACLIARVAHSSDDEAQTHSPGVKKGLTNPGPSRRKAARKAESNYEDEALTGEANGRKRGGAARPPTPHARAAGGKLAKPRAKVREGPPPKVGFFFCT